MLSVTLKVYVSGARLLKVAVLPAIEFEAMAEGAMISMVRGSIPFTAVTVTLDV